MIDGAEINTIFISLENFVVTLPAGRFTMTSTVGIRKAKINLRRILRRVRHGAKVLLDSALESLTTGPPNRKGYPPANSTAGEVHGSPASGSFTGDQTPSLPTQAGELRLRRIQNPRTPNARAVTSEMTNPQIKVGGR